MFQLPAASLSSLSFDHTSDSFYFDLVNLKAHPHTQPRSSTASSLATHNHRRASTASTVSSRTSSDSIPLRRLYRKSPATTRTMSAPATAPPPSSCCGRSTSSGPGCACAAEATCSCGRMPAMKCNCDKSASENKVLGARCSCNQRAQGHCTCKRAATENQKVSGTACACGKRPANSCTCDGTETGLQSNEIDFTNYKGSAA